MTLKPMNATLNVIAPPTLGVPVIAAGTVLATGYYDDPNTGQRYYYNASTDQWYYQLGTDLIPLSVSWAASPTPKLDLTEGDILRFNLTLRHIGPAVTREFYVAVGTNKTSGTFDEWLGYNQTTQISIPAHTALTIVTGVHVDLIIPGGAFLSNHDGEDGAAYCKIMNGVVLVEGENATPYYYDVCHIVSVEGEFTDLAIASFARI